MTTASRVVTAGSPRLFAAPQESLTSDDYYTPAWVFERMGIKFDLDVCAPPGGCDWIPAARYFTHVDDGLAQPWTGRVWMNPPFSAPAPWVDRYLLHGNGVALVPVTASRWFERMWDAVDAIVLLPRVVFVNGDRRGNPYRVVLAALGADCVEAISCHGVARRVA